MKPTAKVRPARWVLVFALVAVVVGGIGVTVGILATRDSTNPAVATTPTAQVTSVRQACQQWLADDPTYADTQGWCSNMAAWMSTNLNGNEMGPQMMWGDPDRLRATCQQWLTESPPASGTSRDDQGWCDDMVDWMLDHMSGWSGRADWGDWMSHGSMMGR